MKLIYANYYFKKQYTYSNYQLYPITRQLFICRIPMIKYCKK